MRATFPFTAILGQDEMKLALLISAVDPSIGGVLVFGDRGTGKSTAVRALADLLPPMRVVSGCQYHCDPGANGSGCEDCQRRGREEPLPSELAAVPVVDLPLGATEDRIVGALDIERALTRGEKRFELGLLARAHRGFLYIDEVNLLEDHLVDLLLDVAASGENLVEREGLSVRHPARFVLIGSGNPEEGELRPQLLDRFGLSVEVSAPDDIPTRVEIVKRRDAFERDPAGFISQWMPETQALRDRIKEAREKLASVTLSQDAMERITGLCIKIGTDGMRGELTMLRAARALAALEGCDVVTNRHLRSIAPSALRHRLRRNPLDESGSSARIHRTMEDVFCAC
ncbi:magnesium chelatase ATPase subunit I [Hyphomicrobium sp.]|uniref:magnesium chelatase ATPase subunit I n=1 Tax=Hyphomicrobium sp. TaxID=82 RepID=UPI000FB4E440|nr:magnesium chelatase ATPase subunit I [Hyphomicrobium sp.]RUP00586.1 MAG: magnesium chelatase ATPase subunit I [Hyphomicrobium sp.]